MAIRADVEDRVDSLEEWVKKVDPLIRAASTSTDNDALRKATGALERMEPLVGRIPALETKLDDLSTNVRAVLDHLRNGHDG